MSHSEPKSSKYLDDGRDNQEPANIMRQPWRFCGLMALQVGISYLPRTFRYIGYGVEQREAKLASWPQEVARSQGLPIQ